MTRAKRVLRVIGIILAVVAVLFVILLVFLTVAEYRPQPVEEVAVTGTSGAPIDGHVRVLTFNIGYAGLGKDQDFFMDGGGMVRPDSKADVGKNLSGIGSTLAGHPADVVSFRKRTSVRTARITLTRPDTSRTLRGKTPPLHIITRPHLFHTPFP